MLKPNYSYWLKLDTWPLKAAIFLLLDINPASPDARDIWRVVEYGKPTPEKRFDPLEEERVVVVPPRGNRDIPKDPLHDTKNIRLAREYNNYAHASHHVGKLPWCGGVDGPAVVEPEQWLRWAQSKSLSLPKPLEDFLKEIEQRGKPKPTQPMTSDSPLIETERDSLLKMVLRMAMGAYDYKLGESRNSATGGNRKSISADLERFGLNLHADTVRKFIKEAETRFKDIIQNPQKS